MSTRSSPLCRQRGGNPRGSSASNLPFPPTKNWMQRMQRSFGASSTASNGSVIDYRSNSGCKMHKDYARSLPRSHLWYISETNVRLVAALCVYKHLQCDYIDVAYKHRNAKKRIEGVSLPATQKKMRNHKHRLQPAILQEQRIHAAHPPAPSDAVDFRTSTCVNSLAMRPTSVAAALQRSTMNNFCEPMPVHTSAGCSSPKTGKAEDAVLSSAAIKNSKQETAARILPLARRLDASGVSGQCSEHHAPSNSRMEEHVGSKSHTRDRDASGFATDRILQAYWRAENNSSKKTFTCATCNAAFSCASALDVHIRIHTATKPFTCIVCERSFARRSSLNAHMRIHTDVIPFACPVCEATFSRKDTLETHIRVHTGEKPLTFTVCEESSAARSFLRAHSRIHSRKKPFPSAICEEFAH